MKEASGLIKFLFIFGGKIVKNERENEMEDRKWKIRKNENTTDYSSKD